MAPSGAAFEVEVVRDEVSRAKGLQERTRLGEREGMLFVQPEPGLHRFWMYKCLIPLDLIWLDGSGRVLHVEAGAPPCSALPCPDYGPNTVSTFVLEVGAGIAARAGIRPGERLELLLSGPARSP